MLQTSETVLTFLQDLGLADQEIKVYLALLEKGELTTLQVAKITSIPRTSVYRILEDLKQKGVIEELVSQHQTKSRITNPERLQILVKKKENQIKRLENNFAEIKNTILQQTGKVSTATKAVYYHGPEGMKQMLWNLLRTKDEFRGYSYCTPVETTGLQFSLDWASEFNERKIKARDLYSDHYQKSAQHHPYPTNVTWPSWESRYISPAKLNIDHQIDIYNNVLAFYDWHDGEIFGVEIYNEKVANLQKQIFDLIWQNTSL